MYGKYKLIKQFEKTSNKKFGTAWFAVNKETNEKVVLKIVQKQTATKTALKQLKEEARFRFNSLYLQSSIELIENQQELILVKEYLEGIRLDNYWKQIKKKKKFITIKELVNKACNTFDELKSKNTIHADIKPSNILVETDKVGEIKAIKLIDFGLAFEQGEQISRKTLFSLIYSAPEIVLNRLQIANHSSDLYAFGIVIYTLLEGNNPFNHQNPSVITNLQINLPLPTLSRRYSNLQLALNKLTYKHSFKLPPNKLTKLQVNYYLENAIANRYTCLNQFYEELKVAEEKKWFLK